MLRMALTQAQKDAIDSLKAQVVALGTNGIGV